MTPEGRNDLASSKLRAHEQALSVGSQAGREPAQKIAETEMMKLKFEDNGSQLSAALGAFAAGLAAVARQNPEYPGLPGPRPQSSPKWHFTPAPEAPGWRRRRPAKGGGPRTPRQRLSSATGLPVRGIRADGGLQTTLEMLCRRLAEIATSAGFEVAASAS